MADGKEEEKFDDEALAFEESVVDEPAASLVEEKEAVGDEAAPEAPKVDQVDIGIIGGGLAGVYAAHKLKAQYPDKTINVYEATGIVGGNQYSAPNNCKDMGWLSAAKHTQSVIIPGEQPLIARLLDEVQVEAMPLIDTSADANFAEFRSKTTAFSASGPASAVEQKNQKEQLRPVEFIKEALDRFFREYPEDKVDDPFSSKRLLTTTIADVLDSFANNSSDTVERVLAYFGEDLESLRNLAVASFLHALPLLTAPNYSRFTVDGGIQNLIVNVLAKSGTELNLGWKLEGIAIDKSSGSKHMRLWSENGNVGKTVIADTVVLCVSPTQAIEIGKKGADVLSGNTSLNVRAWQPSETISGLRPVPHFKAFMKWKMPWWTVLGLRANHCTTDRKIQRVSYFDSGVLAVHCTGQNAVDMKEQFEQNAEGAILGLCQELREVHGFERDDVGKIPAISAAKADSLVWKYWDGGSHVWERGVNGSKALLKIQCGDDMSEGVFLCGSAYSTTPGWMESALCSVQNVLNCISPDPVLWTAVEEGDVARVEEAIQVEGRSLFNINRNDGMSLLHRAAANGDADMVDLLLVNGVSPNLADAQGRTALHWACVGGFDTIVEMLLSNGGDAMAKDNSGATVFQLARAEGHAKVLLVLSTRHLLNHWSRLQEPAPCEEQLNPVPVTDDEAGVVGTVAAQSSRTEDDARQDMINIWKRFDERGLGSLPAEKLAALCTALGSDMESKELDEMKLALCGPRGNTFAFNDFYSFWCS